MVISHKKYWKLRQINQSSEARRHVASVYNKSHDRKLGTSSTWLWEPQILKTVLCFNMLLGYGSVKVYY